METEYAKYKRLLQEADAELEEMSASPHKKAIHDMYRNAKWGFINKGLSVKTLTRQEQIEGLECVIIHAKNANIKARNKNKKEGEIKEALETEKNSSLFNDQQQKIKKTENAFTDDDFKTRLDLGLMASYFGNENWIDDTGQHKLWDQTKHKSQIAQMNSMMNSIKGELENSRDKLHLLDAQDALRKEIAKKDISPQAKKAMMRLSNYDPGNKTSLKDQIAAMEAGKNYIRNPNEDTLRECTSAVDKMVPTEKSSYDHLTGRGVVSQGEKLKTDLAELAKTNPAKTANPVDIKLTSLPSDTTKPGTLENDSDVLNSGIKR